MNASGRTWIGVDPGGAGKFGVAILSADGSCHSCCVDYVDQAIEVVCKRVERSPAGVAVDAPMWWSSGPGGVRKADLWNRESYRLPNRNVQAVNSLWGSVLAQGMMFVERLRSVFPGVNVTESHPKAVLAALGRERWKAHFDGLSSDVRLDQDPDDERDAIISAVAAREGFEGRWKKDLAVDRYQIEQDPSAHWLAPIHYHWLE